MGIDVRWVSRGRRDVVWLAKNPPPIKRNQRLSRACIVHLVIKRTNCSYVKTMPCSSSHHPNTGMFIGWSSTKFRFFVPI
jgi:hypothetical protein